MRYCLLALTFSFLAPGQEVGSRTDLETQYRQAIRALEAAGPSVDLSNVLNGLAAVYYEQHVYSRAEKLSRSALAVEQSLAAPRETEIARRLNNIGAACMAQGKMREASSLVRASLRIYERSDETTDRAFALNNLGVLELKAHRNADASAHFRHAANLLQNDPADLATHLANLAEAQLALGMTRDSLESWSRALALVEANGNTKDRNYGSMLDLYSKALARAGRKAQSVEVRRRGRAILDQPPSAAAYTIDRADFR